MAVLPASLIVRMEARSFSTSSFVSSIMLPITITFSVAVWVSWAWEVAPWAISDMAFSTCSTEMEVSLALTLKVCEAL